MKGIALLILFACGSASASNLVPLTQPTLTGGIAGRKACVGVSFNADGSVVGQCRTVTSPPCSGRGCQPVTTTYNNIGRWDAVGNPLGVEACSVVRSHSPQPIQTTYLNGHSAVDCKGVSFDPTGTSVGVSYGPAPWQVNYFYYVTTDAVTGAELVNSSTAGYLLLP